MPHLIERDHHQFSLERGLGKFASFVPNPVQNCNIADAENACDGAEAHVAHGVEKQGQRLHCRRLATRRRHGEIAAARKAMIPLKAPHNSILHVIRSAAALAANLTHHGGLLLRSPPRVCYRNGKFYLNLGLSLYCPSLASSSRKSGSDARRAASPAPEPSNPPEALPALPS